MAVRNFKIDEKEAPPQARVPAATSSPSAAISSAEAYQNSIASDRFDFSARTPASNTSRLDFAVDEKSQKNNNKSSLNDLFASLQSIIDKS